VMCKKGLVTLNKKMVNANHIVTPGMVINICLNKTYFDLFQPVAAPRTKRSRAYSKRRGAKFDRRQKGGPSARGKKGSVAYKPNKTQYNKPTNLNKGASDKSQYNKAPYLPFKPNMPSNKGRSPVNNSKGRSSNGLKTPTKSPVERKPSNIQNSTSLLPPRPSDGGGPYEVGGRASFRTGQGQNKYNKGEGRSPYKHNKSNIPSDKVTHQSSKIVKSGLQRPSAFTKEFSYSPAFKNNLFPYEKWGGAGDRKGPGQAHVPPLNKLGQRKLSTLSTSHIQKKSGVQSPANVKVGGAPLPLPLLGAPYPPPVLRTPQRGEGGGLRSRGGGVWRTKGNLQPPVKPSFTRGPNNLTKSNNKGVYGNGQTPINTYNKGPYLNKKDGQTEQSTTKRVLNTPQNKAPYSPVSKLNRKSLLTSSHYFVVCKGRPRHGDAGAKHSFL
jgi:hypothetical protein